MIQELMKTKQWAENIAYEADRLSVGESLNSVVFDLARCIASLVDLLIEREKKEGSL